MVKSPRKPGYSSKSVTFEDLSNNFHLPINDVARKLGLCVTVLKQRCREYGIKRWPYRKVHKLDNLIGTLETSTGGVVKGGSVVSALPSVSGTSRSEGSGGHEGTRKLAVAKETRDFLLSNPNSTVHLSVGRVKAQRRRHTLSSGGESGRSTPTLSSMRRAPSGVLEVDGHDTATSGAVGAEALAKALEGHVHAHAPPGPGVVAAALIGRKRGWEEGTGNSAAAGLSQHPSSPNQQRRLSTLLRTGEGLARLPTPTPGLPSAAAAGAGAAIARPFSTSPRSSFHSEAGSAFRRLERSSSSCSGVSLQAQLPMPPAHAAAMAAAAPPASLFRVPTPGLGHDGESAGPAGAGPAAAAPPAPSTSEAAYTASVGAALMRTESPTYRHSASSTPTPGMHAASAMHAAHMGAIYHHLYAQAALHQALAAGGPAAAAAAAAAGGMPSPSPSPVPQFPAGLMAGGVGGALLPPWSPSPPPYLAHLQAQASAVAASGAPAASVPEASAAPPAPPAGAHQAGAGNTAASEVEAWLQAQQEHYSAMAAQQAHTHASHAAAAAALPVPPQPQPVGAAN